MNPETRVTDRVLIQRKASGGSVTVDQFESDIIRFYAGAEALWIVFCEYFDLSEIEMIRRVVLASRKNPLECKPITLKCKECGRRSPFIHSNHWKNCTYCCGDFIEPLPNEMIDFASLFKPPSVSLFSLGDCMRVYDFKVYHDPSEEYLPPSGKLDPYVSAEIRQSSDETIVVRGNVERYYYRLYSILYALADIVREKFRIPPADFIRTMLSRPESLCQKMRWADTTQALLYTIWRYFTYYTGMPEALMLPFRDRAIAQVGRGSGSVAPPDSAHCTCVTCGRVSLPDRWISMVCTYCGGKMREPVFEDIFPRSGPYSFL